MPIEIRHILFSQEEVIRAVVEYHRRSGNPLPAGSVIRIEVMPDPVRCALHFARDDNSRQVAWVDNQPLAAALIMFCINQRIPLPTKSTKLLDVMNDKVTLVVHR
ncbi:hypothetical protein GE253_15670 [Niveispirillum sp. SYP-B3756]|uniref:hypothetical protein n=1 Tax=Niveispirillum sp. SYP-B3756 TaxID=2662178 RepID=UPI001292359D|nr:hypothetical protein [Niveispirillum sp. SYP-B3756]MQP66774.1 hypothetical protein [Niveispirillum sp. SYP-B3756]